MRNIITDTLLFSSPHTIDCCNLLLTGRETEDWQRLKKRHLITFLGFVIIISDLIYLSKTAWPFFGLLRGLLNKPTPSCLQVRKYITLIHRFKGRSQLFIKPIMKCLLWKHPVVQKDFITVSSDILHWTEYFSH